MSSEGRERQTDEVCKNCGMTWGDHMWYDCPKGKTKFEEVDSAEITGLRAEILRYRTALDRIESGTMSMFASKSHMINSMQGIAREALNCQRSK